MSYLVFFPFCRFFVKSHLYLVYKMVFVELVAEDNKMLFVELLPGGNNLHTLKYLICDS